MPDGQAHIARDEDRLERCPKCGMLGELVTAEGDVVVFACPLNGRHDDWSVPLAPNGGRADV